MIPDNFGFFFESRFRSMLEELHSALSCSVKSARFPVQREASDLLTAFYRMQLERMNGGHKFPSVLRHSCGCFTLL